jgi:hypothetical protein
VGFFSSNGFVTLNQLDALYDEVQDLKAVNADLVSYKVDSSYSSRSDILALSNTGFEARTISVDLSKTPLISGITFGQDFVSPPVVVVNAVSDKRSYLAYPENVTRDDCSIRIIPITTLQNQNTSSNPNSTTDFINIIAIGPTVN